VLSGADDGSMMKEAAKDHLCMYACMNFEVLCIYTNIYIHTHQLCMYACMDFEVLCIYTNICIHTPQLMISRACMRA
jgi:hypothetical protein